MVELGVTRDVDVDGDVDVVVAVDVDLDVDVEATGPARTRLTRGANGPELRATFLEREGRGTLL